jgi:hypothetical protein
MTREELIAYTHSRYRLAVQADKAWQFALDRERVNRWSIKAKYDERFNQLYLAKLRADVLMHEANDELRKAN